jgi:cytochrome P450
VFLNLCVYISIEIGVPHATDKDDYYRGRYIPKGASVIPNLTALPRDTELYPHADTFEPERFRDHSLSSAASAIHPDYHQRDHFNYGFGRRLCPGINVAEQSLFIVISRVLWAFDIRAKPGHALDMGSKSGKSCYSNYLLLQLIICPQLASL